ncbi:MAG: efflux RND transporter permease subunit [Oligoflexia bacterium]|nr:efflux RND transporter permease subunit [Oligoflexia bacterium]
MTFLRTIYSSPFRVYLILSLLAAIGIYASTKLPISLYPNTNKPAIYVGMSYGKLNADEFFKQYGQRIESELKGIKNNSLEVEKISADYRRNDVRYNVSFKWGGDPRQAESEVNNVLNSLSGIWPKEIRDSKWVYFNNEGGGFLAISFYSDKRTPDQLYEILAPALEAKLKSFKGAEQAGLWNPKNREIDLKLKMESLSLLGIFPRDIERTLEAALVNYSGGAITEGGKSVNLEWPKAIRSVDDLKKILVTTPLGKLIPLKQLAEINVNENGEHTNIIKTNGHKSIILFASPISGGNVKELAEGIIAEVEKQMKNLPEDIKHRVLVDPSFFIRSAISNVFKEVILAAFLAVLVLMLFIGNWRNTFTAAIEIPLSMILAFILMKLSHMNLNLISLGGLALAAGMNVDASVVVMENIFRHLKKHSKDNSNSIDLLTIISAAVKEVILPILAATICSLVVFIPLTLTKDLTYGILGDLALSVIFSHALSAIVAIILVPTIRIHLFKNSSNVNFTVEKALIDRPFEFFLKIYQRVLNFFLINRSPRIILIASLISSIAILPNVILPKLKKEIIGRPDTDWLVVSIHANNSQSIRETESYFDEIETKILKENKEFVNYTFTQVHGTWGGNIMLRLNDKSKMNEFWKLLEQKITSTPDYYIRIVPWNPAELPIPELPQMRLVISGGENEDRFTIAQIINYDLRTKGIFPDLWSKPSLSTNYVLEVRPSVEHWPILLAQQGIGFSPSDLLDITRVATNGKYIDDLLLAGKNFRLKISYKDFDENSGLEKINSIPINLKGKIVPFKALVPTKMVKMPPPLYREDGESLIAIYGKHKMGEEDKKVESLQRVENLIKEFWDKDGAKLNLSSKPMIYLEDSEKELTDALDQLKFSIIVSVLLVLLTLVIQFASIAHSLIILSAIPLGMLGVMLSLFIFKSTLSLNSAIGVILLNGIAVGNSILLVDLFRRFLKEGHPPITAIMMSATQRIRPILITSLTTILGMLPIAFGMGNGGKVLQPLGIAVAGGLWVSMFFTLIVVPILEITYVNFITRIKLMKKGSRVKIGIVVLSLTFVSAANATAGATATAVAVITFEEALALALNKNNNLSLLREDVELSNLNIQDTAAKLKFLPTVNIEQTHTKRWFSTDEGFKESNKGNALYLNSKLNLFNFGADFSNYKANAIRLQQQQVNITSVQMKQEKEVIDVFLQYIYLSQELQILNSLLLLKKELLSITEKRYQKGICSKEEFLAITVEVDNTIARYDMTLINRDELSRQILKVINLSNLSNLSNEENAKGVNFNWSWPWLNKIKNDKFLIENQIVERPDIKFADLSLQVNQHRLWYQMAQNLPRVDLSYQYRLDPLFYISDSGMSKTKSNEKILLLTISIPLFDGGDGWARYHQQNSELIKSQYELQQLKRNADSEIKINLNKYRGILKTLSNREKTLELSMSIYEKNFQRFKMGQLSLNDLLTEQSRLFESKKLVDEGFYVIHQTFLSLCQSMGKSIYQCL